MPAPFDQPTGTAAGARRRRRWVPALAVAAAVGAAVVAPPGVAAAAPATLQVTPATVAAGSAVTVAGGCEPGSAGFVLSRAFVRDATHEFGGVGAVAFTSDAAGAFVTHPVVAATTAPGSYPITARCGGGNLGVAARLTVTAASGAPSAASLAVTPSSVAAGRAVTVSGRCEPGSAGFVLSRAFVRDATHEFGGVGAVAFTSDAAGAFLVHPVVARTTPPGSYGVTARCGGGNLGVAARLAVTAAATRPPTTVPAGTGGRAAVPDSRPVGALVLGGVGVLLVAGAGAGLVRRRSGGPR